MEEEEKGQVKVEVTVNVELSKALMKHIEKIRT